MHQHVSDCPCGRGLLFGIHSTDDEEDFIMGSVLMCRNCVNEYNTKIVHKHGKPIVKITKKEKD